MIEASTLIIVALATRYPCEFLLVIVLKTIPLSIVTSARFMQFPNARSSIVPTDSGIVIEFIAVSEMLSYLLFSNYQVEILVLI